MRRMEQAADALYKAKLIRGFCHLAIGQEAVSVGMESAIDENDRVITSYRCHTFAVLRGGTILGVLAELMGESLGSDYGVEFCFWKPWIVREDWIGIYWLLDRNVLQSIYSVATRSGGRRSFVS